MSSATSLGETMTRDLKNVGHHGGRGRHLPGTLAEIHARSKGLAIDVDGVEGAGNTGQKMTRRDHGRMNPRLDTAVIFGNRQKLDGEAQLARIVDIGTGDTADALGIDLRGFEP